MAESSREPRTRIRCPVCTKLVAITTSGRLWRHTGSDRSAGGQNWDGCPAGGKSPTEANRLALKLRALPSFPIANHEQAFELLNQLGTKVSHFEKIRQLAEQQVAGLHVQTKALEADLGQIRALIAELVPAKR